MKLHTWFKLFVGGRRLYVFDFSTSEIFETSILLKCFEAAACIRDYARGPLSDDAGSFDVVRVSSRGVKEEEWGRNRKRIGVARSLVVSSLKDRDVDICVMEQKTGDDGSGTRVQVISHMKTNCF